MMKQMFKISTLYQVKVLITQLWLTLCNPLDCNLPGSSFHGILQARIMEWVAFLFSLLWEGLFPNWASDAGIIVIHFSLIASSASRLLYLQPHLKPVKVKTFTSKCLVGNSVISGIETLSCPQNIPTMHTT